MRALWIGILLTTACGVDSSSQVPCDPPASYLACGCGCCGGVEPAMSQVDAQTMCEVIAQDRQSAANPGCAMAGCSLGIRYELLGQPPNLR